MATSKNRRRWYQFGLRTFLVLITLACVGFAYWVHWSREWIRQREEVMRGDAVYHSDRVIDSADDLRMAPAGLWLFGETGYSQILLEAECDSPAKIRELFPEARVYESKEWNASHRDPQLKTFSDCPVLGP
jgi:hypothetical protein